MKKKQTRKPGRRPGRPNQKQRDTAVIKVSESSTAKVEIRESTPFGFGLANIGLLPVRYPVVSAILIVLATAICLVGAARVKTDDAIKDLYKSETPAYQNYMKLSESFPAGEYDVLLVVQGEALLERDNLEELRNMHLDLNFVEAVDGITSVFSIREQFKNNSETPPSIIPSELPEGNEYDNLIEKVRDHPLVAKRLLADKDAKKQVALFVIALKPEVLATKGIRASVNEIKEIASGIIEPTGLGLGLTGAPVMKLELVNATKRDRLIFNGLGFFVGFTICLLFFRRFRLVLISNIAPAFAVLWATAILGFSGIALNPLNTTIMPLVMVIAFTDCMHLTFSFKRKLEEGANKYDAARHAVMTIGPACALTSITTALAMLSLYLTDSALIQMFGLTAAAATLVAFLSVITIVPTMAILVIRDEEHFRARSAGSTRKLAWMENFCEKLATWLEPRHIQIAVSSMAIVVLCAVMYLNLKPYYRLSDIVPDRGQAAKVMQDLDDNLAGVHPVQVLIEWPKNETAYSSQVLETISQTENVLKSTPGIGNIWSVNTIRRWLAESGDDSPEFLKQYMEKLPGYLPKRFINSDRHTAIVSGYMKNLEAKEVVSITDTVDKSLSRIRAENPDIKITVTGMSVAAAYRTVDIIGQLNIGLFVAVIVVILLIALAFKSFAAAWLSIVPNLFALVGTGSLLFIFGKGLEYSSVVALTVAFGLAVDDTIHFLNRLNLERDITDNLKEAVRRSLIRIGPVIILTTVVLILGMAVTGFSGVPPIRLFGQLCMATLIFALVGDLLFLPAIVLLSERFLTSKNSSSMKSDRQTPFWRTARNRLGTAVRG